MHLLQKIQMINSTLLACILARLHRLMASEDFDERQRTKAEHLRDALDARQRIWFARGVDCYPISRITDLTDGVCRPTVEATLLTFMKEWIKLNKRKAEVAGGKQELGAGGVLGNDAEVEVSRDHRGRGFTSGTYSSIALDTNTEH
jgi:hypothetical protein